MALGDLFKAKENEELKMALEESKRLLKECREKFETRDREAYDYHKRVMELEALLTPEISEAVDINRKIRALKRDLEWYNANISDAEKKLAELKKDLIVTEEEVLMQSFGLYKPSFEFANSTKYKEQLARERVDQKALIKEGKAVTGKKDWTVNGNATEGRKLIKDTQKLLLRAFNTECDDIVSKVKFNNIDASVKRIISSWESISKLGKIFEISISEEYCHCKIAELYLSYEYQVAKQQEKDRLKQLRAEERERAKLEKEIQEARKKIEKEQKHYTNALAKITQQIQSADPAELPALEEKKAALEGTLGELGKSMEQIDYRAANQKAGYVYIISNIGAFGEGVYKIGMTRRLEPMDRVDELGDASVPFDFDVHALIFSDNAPALEAALHHAFEDRKLNMVNTRREFFRVSLDEIKEVVQKNYDKTVEFYDVPLAEQFRQSELIRTQK